MKFREFKVLGERCSGTNHAKALIEKNLPLVERSACCWKHEIADPEAFHKNRDLRLGGAEPAGLAEEPPSDSTSFVASHAGALAGGVYSA